jgi:hypothetical protein
LEVLIATILVPCSIIVTSIQTESAVDSPDISQPDLSADPSRQYKGAHDVSI